MDRPISSWEYGLAPFQLGICNPPPMEGTGLTLGGAGLPRGRQGGMIELPNLVPTCQQCDNAATKVYTFPGAKVSCMPGTPRPLKT